MKRSRAVLPFLLVAAVGFLYHIQMQPMGGDDVFFSEALRDSSLIEYLSHRYLNWTSRVVSEGILVTVIQFPLLWRVIDYLMFASFPVIFARLFDDSLLMHWCGAAAVLLFPFHDMGTAGWITTTVTHFWPLWGTFFLALLVKRMAAQEKIHPAAAVLGVFVCIMAGSHEQYAVILAVMLVLTAVRLWMEKRKPAHAVLFAVIAAVTALSLLVIALCPGNAGRNAVSLADLPVYETFGFGDKLYLGLLGIERVFIANADMLFCMTSFLWTALVCLKTGDFKKTLLSSGPLLILFGQTVVRAAYPGLSGLFVIPGEILEWSWGDLSTWIPMVYLAVSVVSMIYALYQLFGEKLYEYICVLILLGCGFGAGMVLGFMATIYVSGERVYAPLCAILLSVTLLAVYRQKDAVLEKLKTAAGKLAATFVALSCCINVLFIALSV